MRGIAGLGRVAQMGRTARAGGWAALSPLFKAQVVVAAGVFVWQLRKHQARRNAQGIFDTLLHSLATARIVPAR